MPLDQDPIDSASEKDMPFLEHLEELRWHVIRSIIAIMVFTIVAFVNVKWIFGSIILGPAKADFPTWSALCKLGHFVGKPDILCIEDIPLMLQSRFMTGQFTITIISAFVIGLVLSFPYIVFELWRFIRPGLKRRERESSTGVVTFVSSLFLAGICFGYFVIAPLMVYVMVNYQVSDMIVNEFDITSYVSTVLTLVLGSGALFQLPVVIYFLSKFGIITPAFLKKYRRHAVVIILIIAAIITPPDPISQILISIPLYFLFEISIMISRSVEKKRLKEQAEND
jgi:sec-independent protein translocase protein TatC